MSKYYSRYDADPGLWCSLLIPISFLTNTLVQHEVPNKIFARIYTEVCVVSIGLLVTSMCWITVKWRRRNPHFSITLHIFCFFISFLIAAILVGLTSRSMLLYFLLSYYSVLVCCWICSTLLSACASSFTAGEAIIVAQSCTLFFLSCFLCIIEEVFKPTDLNVNQILESTKFAQVLLFGCSLLLLILYMLPCLRNACGAYTTFFCIGGFTYVLWIIYLRKEPILWLLLFSFNNSTRVLLILYWAILVCLSVLFVTWQNEKELSKASTTVRKFFHIVMILVYIPGVILDPELLYLASSLALAVFLVLELIRLLKLPPFGPTIDNAFQVFLDEKDAGVLVLTHIYLLVGCSCPFWLYSHQFSDKGYHICLMSGIISVGFGDTVASAGGSIWGKHKWPGSKKTVEGTALAIAAQLTCVVPLLLIGHMLSTYNLLISIMGVVLTSLLEAKTTQVDNLVLPLFLFSILSLIS